MDYVAAVRATGFIMVRINTNNTQIENITLNREPGFNPLWDHGEIILENFVMSKDNMIHWSGISLILAGVCIALGTIIHPSKETPQIILAEETRLITGHWF